MRSAETVIQALLPLPPATFHILVSLSAGDRHGYGIMQDVEARTDGALRLSAGTLYRTIQRLLDEGLITEVSGAAALKDDPRRRYYRITRLGTAVARADAERLARMIDLARGAGLLPEGAS